MGGVYKAKVNHMFMTQMCYAPDLPRFARTLIVVAVCCVVALVASPVSADNSGPETAASSSIAEKDAFARDFAEKVLAIIQDTKKKYDDRKSILRQAFSDSVDIDWIAQFVLGRSWLRTSDDLRQRYVKAYKRYLTESYVSNFAEDPDKRIRDIKIQQVFDAQDDTFNVRTLMMLANQDNLSVTYLVHEKEGRYRVRDIAIENVSLITSHRTEFAHMAATEGIEKVISELEARVERMQEHKSPFSVSRAGSL